MIREALRIVTTGKDLSYDLAKEVMETMMSGGVEDIPMAAFLGALQAKGPSVTEITAFAEVLRDKAGSVPHEGKVVEIVGTGGDGASTFNISTTASFVVAAAGIPVAKHGNRSVSSQCGAADVLEALGAKLELDGLQNQKVLEDTQFCFMFAPVYHQAMKYAAPVRKSMGVRTVFNVLGPLANPAGATIELMGVYEESLIDPMAKVLMNLGVVRGAVVHGSDGLDEITATGTTTVIEINHGTLRRYSLDPKDFGLSYATADELVGGNATVNAKITKQVLRGEDHSGRKTAIILNAGMAIYLAKDGSVSLEQAMTEARHIIESGRAYPVLKAFVKATQTL